MTFGLYSPTGDILTIALCFMCWAFLLCTYSKQQKMLSTFYAATITIACTAIESLAFHWILNNVAPGTATSCVLYTLETTVYCSTISMFLWFLLYIMDLLHLKQKTRKIIWLCTIPAYTIYTIFRLIKPFLLGYYVPGQVWIYSLDKQWGFVICYISYALSLLILLTIFTHRLSPLMLRCLRLNIYIALFLTMGELIFSSSTMLTTSFMFPIISALLLFHYNTYNVHTGALSKQSFPQYLQDNKKQSLGMYCLRLKDFPFHNHNDISILFLKNAADVFKKYQAFYIDDNTVMLVFNRKYNLSFNVHENIVRRRLKLLYDTYHIPYKLTYSECDLEVLPAQDYLILHQYLMDKTEWNDYTYCTYEDISKVNRSQEIKLILQEIDQKKLLEHPSVQIYCQPIWDIKTQSYRSIEILSRLKYNDEIIMPDEYLPIAQYYGYQYSYNTLVFNQACAAFANLLNNGVDLDTLSMNFTIQEFTGRTFIHDIMGIAKKHNVPCDKIAIEITESVSTTVSPEEVRKIIWKLKARGIKVYLDDFGVDYSNINRVLNLPVDVIKFDKSITWALREDTGLKSIISNMATSFSQSGYKVLFEGVETLEDEQRCLIMNAAYLQGFKFSQPIEIESLPEFLY